MLAPCRVTIMEYWETYLVEADCAAPVRVLYAQLLVGARCAEGEAALTKIVMRSLTVSRSNAGKCDIIDRVVYFCKGSTHESNPR